MVYACKVLLDIAFQKITALPAECLRLSDCPVSALSYPTGITVMDKTAF
jgi:hypothetical protein